MTELTGIAERCIAENFSVTNGHSLSTLDRMLWPLKRKLICYIMPLFTLLMLHQMLLTTAYLKSVRVEEIPFGLSVSDRKQEGLKLSPGHRGIHAMSQIEEHRGFFHIFNVPYIVCFFAAKGKWPFIPPFMQVRVDSVSKTLFSHNDSYIQKFCQKWIQIKQCFRPIFSPTVNTEVDNISPLKASTPCTCAQNGQQSVVYFDKNYVGNVSSETILNTIEFLESFLPPPTKKTKKKNRVRSRLDDMDID